MSLIINNCSFSVMDCEFRAEETISNSLPCALKRTQNAEGGAGEEGAWVSRVL
ncbi:hypothetical protein MTsN4n12_22260 [Microbacterium sp. MTN4-12]